MKKVIVSIGLGFLFLVVPFLASADEYTGTKEEIVRSMYEDMFGEAPSQDSVVFWVNHFPNGGAGELMNVYANTYLRMMTLENVYQEMLGRNWPYLNDYEYIFHLEHRTRIDRLRDFLAVSEERKNKYNQMYRHFLGREISDEEWSGRLEFAKRGEFQTIDELRSELIVSEERKTRMTELFVKKTGAEPNRIQSDILFDPFNRTKDENKSFEKVEAFLDGELDLEIETLWSNDNGYCYVIGLVNYGIKPANVSGYRFKNGKYEIYFPDEGAEIGPYQRYYLIPEKYYEEGSIYSECRPGIFSYLSVDMTKFPTVSDFEAYQEVIEGMYDMKGIQLLNREGEVVTEIKYEEDSYWY